MGDGADNPYKLKGTTFFGRPVPIVVQNENGPCPLLAIANILLMRNAIHLPPGLAEVTQVRRAAEFTARPIACCPVRLCKLLQRASS